MGLAFILASLALYAYVAALACVPEPEPSEHQLQAEWLREQFKANLIKRSKSQ